MTEPARASVERSRGGGLAEVVELILDKGLVIDAYVRVSLVGIELITIDARIVVASVDTYLRFAEATNRLDLTRQGSSPRLPPAGDLPETRAPVESPSAHELDVPAHEDEYEDEYEYEERPKPARRRSPPREEREP